MAEDKPKLNGMVFNFLKSVSSKLANQFKKNVGSEFAEIATDSPTIPELVDYYNLNESAKRKADDMVNGGSKAKKAKLNGSVNGKKADSEDSDDDSDASSAEEAMEQEPAVNGKAAVNGKPAAINGKKKEESSDDDDDSSSEDEAPVAKTTPAKTTPAKATPNKKTGVY